jgi:hypothetical protein
MSLAVWHARQAERAYRAQAALVAGRDAEGRRRPVDAAPCDRMRKVREVLAEIEERVRGTGREPEDAWWVIDQSVIDGRGRLVRSARVVRGGRPPVARYGQSEGDRFVAGPYVRASEAYAQAEAWADSVVECVSLERFMSRGGW